MLHAIRDYLTIKLSGTFDPAYYLTQYPDVRRADTDPLKHFVKFGWKEDRNPSVCFNTRFYLDQYPDVRQANVNPLVHYIRFGRKEGRQSLSMTQKLLISPKISVIIPTFNGCATIKKTLESVVRQSYRNFEVIIVDDGSTDSTLEIVRKVIPKAKIILQKHQGTMGARQTGINAATGDLIALLDQDDIWFEDNLQTEVDYLNHHPDVGFVFGNMQAIDESGNDLNFNVIPDADNYHISWERLLLVGPIALSTALFRKDVVDKIGGLDVAYGHSGALGDTDLFVRSIEVTNLHFINRNLGQYRWSETRPGRLESFLDNLKIFARKFWQHPNLQDVNNQQLREKYVLTCCNYAIHIFRLLLNHFDNQISLELLFRLNKHNQDMRGLFGELHTSLVGLDPLDLDLFSITADYQALLLYLYMLRADLQKQFPMVQQGEIQGYLQWAKNVVGDRTQDNDADTLKAFGTDIQEAEESTLINYSREIAFPPVHDSKTAIVVLPEGDGKHFYRFMKNLSGRLTNACKVIAFVKPDAEHFREVFKNITLLPWHEGLSNPMVACFSAIKHCDELETILFLSDSIRITTHYIESLQDLLLSDPSIGLVSGKILSAENGLILHAGGVFQPDSKVFLFGSGKQEDHPEVSYVRSVDIPFEGGFGIRKDLLHLNFEKVDETPDFLSFCREVMKLGYRIKYQPEAKAFIPETSVLIKENNETRKVPGTATMQLKHRTVEADVNVLAIDDYIPALHYGSGFPRLYAFLNMLADLDYSVTFFPVGNPVKVQPETSHLQQKGIEVFYEPFADLAEFLKGRDSYFDVVFLSRPHVFEKYYSIVRASLPKTTIVYDAEALYFTREQLKNQLKPMDNKADILKVKEHEMRLIELPDIVLSVSEREKTQMLQASKQKNVEVWGHIQELYYNDIGFDEREDILFVGSFFAGPGSPNEDAALFFARQVFPEIQKHLNCKLFVVGSYPTPQVMELNSDGIVVTGFVDDLGSCFNRCRVNVVPTRFAAGIPQKLTDALSYGIPTVTSTIIAEQLDLQDYQQVLIARDAKEFVRKVIELYTDRELWEKIRKNSYKFIENNFSREIMKKSLDMIMQKALSISNDKYQ